MLYTFNNCSVSRTINLVDVIMLSSLIIVTDEAVMIVIVINIIRADIIANVYAIYYYYNYI